MSPTKFTTVTLERIRQRLVLINDWIECCTHIALSKGRTLSMVYDRGLTTASGALVRSEAETEPEDPRLAACCAANFEAIWAMVV